MFDERVSQIIPLHRYRHTCIYVCVCVVGRTKGTSPSGLGRSTTAAASSLLLLPLHSISLCLYLQKIKLYTPHFLHGISNINNILLLFSKNTLLFIFYSFDYLFNLEWRSCYDFTTIKITITYILCFVNYNKRISSMTRKNALGDTSLSLPLSHGKKLHIFFL